MRLPPSTQRKRQWDNLASVRHCPLHLLLAADKQLLGPLFKL